MASRPDSKPRRSSCRPNESSLRSPAFALSTVAEVTVQAVGYVPAKVRQRSCRPLKEQFVLDRVDFFQRVPNTQKSVRKSCQLQSGMILYHSFCFRKWLLRAPEKKQTFGETYLHQLDGPCPARSRKTWMRPRAPCHLLGTSNIGSLAPGHLPQWCHGTPGTGIQASCKV